MTVSKFASKDKKKKGARISYQFPTFWSYSRWAVADKCLRRYELQHLAKLPQPPAPALERGIRVHQEGENYLDVGGRVPKSYAAFSDEMKAIRKLGANAEGSYAFTKSWQACSPTDWKSAWLRVKIDAEITDAPEPKDVTELTQIDFKTGKPWAKDTEVQSELYAVTGFLRFPKVDAVDVEFWYVDNGEVVPYVYTRNQYPELKKKWAARGRELIAARQFPPTNNSYNCKYCPFRSDVKLGNGQPGPCDAWRKAK
jgi:hypothetical protein